VVADEHRRCAAREKEVSEMEKTKTELLWNVFFALVVSGFLIVFFFPFIINTQKEWEQDYYNGQPTLTYVDFSYVVYETENETIYLTNVEKVEVWSVKDNLITRTKKKTVITFNDERTITIYGDGVKIVNTQ